MLYQKLLEIYKSYRKWKTYPHVTDDYWSSRLVEQNISPSQVEYESGTGKLLYKPLALQLKKEAQDFLLIDKVSNKAKALKTLARGKFYIDDRDELVLDVDDVKLIVETAQELEIVHEIFCLGVYNFIHERPCIVIDIGMNTGFASLFFASRENVRAVYGYEPIESTFDQALKNFALNPRVSGKIKAFDYGVGAREETMVVEYNYKVKGSVGVDGIDELFKPADRDEIVREELTIKPFGELFSHIVAAHPDEDIVAKIDCEGSEYGILDTLAERGQLSAFKIIMMEWHKKGPDPLVKHLQEAGFIIFSRLPRSQNVGTLYAVRA